MRFGFEEALMSFPISFLLLPLPFVLLYFEGKNFKQSLEYLGFSREKPARQALDGLKLLALFLAAFFCLGAALQVLGLLDSYKVVEVVRAQPFLVLAAAVTLAPVAEEMFFRGYLQKKIGVVLSSVIFAAVHYAYGSVAEVIAAFLMGLIAGWWVKKHGRLASAVIAHALWNAASIILALTILGLSLP